MESEERKQKLVVLMQEMLDTSGGIKSVLARRLEIKPPRLTTWLQGKVDPASIEIQAFARIARVKGYSVDELAKLFGLFYDRPLTSLDKLRNLITEMLRDLSQEQLGEKLNISKNTIRGWLNPGKNINPALLPASTIASLAQEKGWTIEKLLIYLDLKEFIVQENSLFELQSRTTSLPLTDQITFLSWLFNLLFEKINSPGSLSQNKTNLKESSLNDRKIQIVLEQEDNAIRDADLSLAQIATSYSSNLVHHLQLKPDNIQVTTIPKLPQSLDHIDVLIFDISSPDSPSIALIQDISFDGDIVVFASEDLPENLRAGLEDRVTDVLVKPINWSSLKDKEYFRSTKL